MNSANEQIQIEQDETLLVSAEDSNAPVGIFELIDRQPSGMIRDGTDRLPDPVELDVAGFRQLMINSAYREKVEDEKTGKPKWKRVPIRYRASSTSIDPAVQDAEGAPANFENDRIVVKNGRIIVVREGLTEALYDYMKKDSRNASNLDRIPTVPALYKEIFPEKEDEIDNVSELQLGRALRMIDELIISEKAGDIKYDEFRLEAFSSLFNVRSDNPAGIIKGLIGTAKLNPVDFIAKARGMQDRLIVDIEHAEMMGVIQFEKGRVFYPSKNKMILPIPSHVKGDRVKDYLISFFMSEKGNFAYQEFLTELNAVKAQALKGPDGGSGGADPNANAGNKPVDTGEDSTE